MSRCKACNKPLSATELATDGMTEGVPDDLCTSCRSISSNPDDAENMPQNLNHLLWDEFYFGDRDDG